MMPTSHTSTDLESSAHPMAEFRNVSKRFVAGSVIVTALDNVNLQISRGEYTVLMGPSGSGKSSLLQILGTLDRPSEGVYALEGQDIGGLSDTELARIRNQQFGFVFQSYNLFEELSAWENVALPLVYAGVGARSRRDRALHLLEAVGLTDRTTHLPTQLSGGQQQRVAIARALVADPTLILADEPTGNLSRRDGEEILTIFDRLNNDGVSIVMVTHDEWVGSQARRQIRLQDGRVITTV
jgi:putative ABC transport system ATP-binding protein